MEISDIIFIQNWSSHFSSFSREKVFSFNGVLLVHLFFYCLCFWCSINKWKMFPKFKDRSFSMFPSETLKFSFFNWCKWFIFSSFLEVLFKIWIPSCCSDTDLNTFSTELLLYPHWRSIICICLFLNFILCCIYLLYLCQYFHVLNNLLF